jgi:hypothetical protein
VRTCLPAIIACIAASTTTNAAETDQYFAWRHPPADSTKQIDAAVNAALARGLARANADGAATCRDAAAAMTAPLSSTARYYFVGPVRAWHLSVEPAGTDEQWQVAGSGLYRYGGLAPFGRIIPLDPTVKVGVVLFGTDKIGHFFTNGVRYFDRFLAARAGGASDDDAVRAAIASGVDEEAGWLGMTPSGVFSFADLQANERGLAFFRALCDGGELAVVDGRWTLTVPFSIARWVDPCWDESFSPNAYAKDAADAIVRALTEMCPALSAPDVVARRRAYRAMGCSGAGVPRAWMKEGRVPDPSRFDIDRVCAE